MASEGTDLAAQSTSEPPDGVGLAEPAHVVPAEMPALRTLAGIAVGVVAIAGLYLGRDVLVPIMLAALLSLILAPLAAGLRRLHLGRVPSVVLAVLFALAVIGAIGTVIGNQLAALSPAVPHYAQSIEKKVRKVRGSSLLRFPRVLSRLSGNLDSIAAGPPEFDPDSPGRSGAQQPVPVEVHSPPATPLQTVRAVIQPILGPLETTLIVVVVAVFILLQREDLRDRIIRLFGSSDLHRTTLAMDEAAGRLSRYFLAQLGINTAFGTIIATGLWLLGVPSPVLWGVVAALMRFVPYVGAFLSAVPPLLISAAIAPDWSPVLWTAALFLITEPTMGYLVEPMVYGHSTGLSPFSVIVAAIFWTWLWGPIGLILSTPLTLCLVVLGRHVDRLEFFDVLLGDRPALTPAESFYQRMLAGDPDEALDQAEPLLRQRALSTYYDEVAVKGLQMAAADAARGVLSKGQLGRIRRATGTLIEDLADRGDDDPFTVGEDQSSDLSKSEQAVPDRPPPSAAIAPQEVPAEWANERAVLCLGGRSPLDDAVAEMLAQLLAAHGIGAVALQHGAISRERLDELNVTGVKLACLVFVELADPSQRLRLLLRRLRRRMPDAKLLVGLWPAEHAVFGDEQIAHGMAADGHAASLHDLVGMVVKQATGLPDVAPAAAQT